MTPWGNSFNDTHLFLLTDDTGIFQHTRYSIPDLSKGYTTDDNARAFILGTMLYEEKRTKEYLTLVMRYLAFILYAQNDDGHFRNFMTYSREFTEDRGSEDCFGRCFWALSYGMASSRLLKGIKSACASAIKLALPQIPLLQSARGQAYAIIGLGLLGAEYDDIIKKLADSLAAQYEHCAAKTSWYWFEDMLTYDNALLPWALFVAFQQTKQVRFLQIAQQSLLFLDQATFQEGFFHPIGCTGWWPRGSNAALYDQQPVEASMATLAHIAAFKITGEKKMLSLAQQSFSWYLGKNSLGKSLIDPDTGGCFDGLTPTGVNENQGSESIVGYGIAKLALSAV